MVAGAASDDGSVGSAGSVHGENSFKRGRKRRFGSFIVVDSAVLVVVVL